MFSVMTITKSANWPGVFFLPSRTTATTRRGTKMGATEEGDYTRLGRGEKCPLLPLWRMLTTLILPPVRRWAGDRVRPSLHGTQLEPRQKKSGSSRRAPFKTTRSTSASSAAAAAAAAARSTQRH